MSLFTGLMGLDEIDKVIIESAFDGKVDIDKMNGDVAEELAEVISNLMNTKDSYCRLVKKSPELTNIYLKIFGNYVKYQGRIFNAECSEEKVKFSGLLGRYMREIKNASMENRK